VTIGRFADRCAAHAHLLDQLALEQSLPRLKQAGEDRIPQLPQHKVAGRDVFGNQQIAHRCA
jgi:hypothetical protein